MRLGTATHADNFKAVDSLNVGYVQNEKGKYAGAIADFTRAIEIGPQYADAYASRGWAKYKLDDHNGAIADWEKAIELDPSRKANLQPMIDDSKAKLSKG